MAARRIPAQPRFADRTLNRFAEQTIAALKVQSEGGIVSLDYGSPVALAYGGAGSDGVSTDVARADHVHALPALPSGGTVWDGRVVPASGLHATSDEFDVDTIGSGKWLDWDVGAYQTHAIDTTRKCMTMGGGSGAGQRYGGRYQAIPAGGEFTVAVWCSADGALSGATLPSVGLVIADDLTANPATADFMTLNWVAQRSANNSSVQTSANTVYNALGTLANTRTVTGKTGIWLRLRVSPAGWEADYSDTGDGETWITISPLSAFTFTVVHFGLMFNAVDAKVDQHMFRYFRVWDGVSGVHDTRNGGYL